LPANEEIELSLAVIVVVHILCESMKRTNVGGFRAAKIAAMYRPFDPCIVGSIVLYGNEKRNTKRTTTSTATAGVVDIDPSLFSLLNMLRLEQFACAPYDGYITCACEEKLGRVLPLYSVSTIHISFSFFEPFILSKAYHRICPKALT